MLQPSFLCKHAKKTLPLCLLLLVILPVQALCATESPTASLSVQWVIPFIGMLLSIALFPLLAPSIWHHHYGKIAFAWGMAFLLPFGFFYSWEFAGIELGHALLMEYVPFILLLLALFTVSGGIKISGTIASTPIANSCILLIGASLASIMGTTGAAMLLIRPIIRSNANRKYKTHTIIFFIFLVANIGGSLTPLGDPPLFLGFLQGVGFFWTTSHLLLPMLLVGGILLVAYFLLDTWLYKKEDIQLPTTDEPHEKIRIEGGINFFFLFAIIASVLVSGIWKPGISFNFPGGIHLELQSVCRDVIFIIITLASWALTAKRVRIENDFTWEPIFEVAKLFLGIFISMIPAIAILRAGEHGALASVVSLVSNNGQPNHLMYFWITGLLSGFLDNAPTYLVFFNTAGGNVELLTTTMSTTLMAISTGAVFMGALTYIGNAPNFMVRSIAVSSGVQMPSFFGYMLWSVCLLVPSCALMGWLFFA